MVLAAVPAAKGVLIWSATILILSLLPAAAAPIAVLPAFAGEKRLFPASSI